MSFFKSKPTASTKFSEFIRNASSAEKKKVYSTVLRKATERQKRVMEAAGAASTPAKAGGSR